MKRLGIIVLLSLAFTVLLGLPRIKNLVDRLYRHAVETPPHLMVKNMQAPKGFNEEAFRKAMQYYSTHRKQLGNKRYLTIIDYSKPSFTKRMYVIDLWSGRVRSCLVAHGKNSGLVVPTDFSNEIDSLKSCCGFFLTGGRYVGKHGTAMVLHGLEKGVNDNAEVRNIVLHGAEYAGPRSILLNRGRRLGLSWGCPVVPPEDVEWVVEKLEKGSLLYIHTETNRRTGTSRS
jgi:hypothetical protein